VGSTGTAARPTARHQQHAATAARLIQAAAAVGRGAARLPLPPGSLVGKHAHRHNGLLDEELAAAYARHVRLAWRSIQMTKRSARQPSPPSRCRRRSAGRNLTGGFARRASWSAAIMANSPARSFVSATWARRRPTICWRAVRRHCGRRWASRESSRRAVGLGRRGGWLPARYRCGQPPNEFGARGLRPRSSRTGTEAGQPVWLSTSTGVAANPVPEGLRGRSL
jgi:hypothetical protein